MRFYEMYLAAMVLVGAISLFVLICALVGFIRQRRKPKPDILDNLITESQYSDAPMSDDTEGYSI